MPLPKDTILFPLLGSRDSMTELSEKLSANGSGPSAESQLAALVMLYLVLAVGLALVIARQLRWVRIRRKVRALYLDRYAHFHQLLYQFNPYFRGLSSEQQNRFIRRTLVFRLSKKFHFVELVPEERIPLLISAAATQISFGLDRFLFRYFNDIYVMRKDYHYGIHNQSFEGHVTNQGIYLSWQNFEEAFKNYADGNNVGLHEMAHALAYVNFHAIEAEDRSFVARFREFSTIGRPVFQQMQAGQTNMLGAYAATNYEEFWAVCIEHFFERPIAFRDELPELYEAVARVLNQDSLKPGLFLTRPKDA